MLKLGIQKSGRLSEKSLNLIKNCGINFDQKKAKLKFKAANFPIEIYFLRDDDIPVFLKEKIIDIGIVGQNVLEEKMACLPIVKELGFSSCRLSIAIPKSDTYNGISDLSGKTIATSYPQLLRNYLDKQQVSAQVVEISGSVEIGPSIGMSDAVCDIVSSGSTLLANGLKEVEKIYNSQAVLASSEEINSEQQGILEELLMRINAVQNAESNKYILLNAPNNKLEEIVSIIPGMKSPTVVQLADSGWSSVQSVVKEDEFWNIIGALKKAGAEGILVSPIEKMIL